ncbi:type 1 glutamine amidotransferase domain-containing protein [Neisseriaceae bacterium TC5R-5]|nr:type 1 glutamine amidotransferase domain-containing protein [Neisseriaceae bacterium TC5R-5]
MRVKLKLLAAGLVLASVMASAGNVLVVLSDVDYLDLKDGKRFATGFYLNEMMQPVKMLLDAGHQVTFATPEGRAPAMDKKSLNPVYFGGSKAAMDEHFALLEKLQVTSATQSPVISLARVEQIGYGKFDAVYVPGGHAPMQDLLTSRSLGRLLTAFHQQGKTTALVCHGPIALLAALPDAAGFKQQMVSGKQVQSPNWIYAGYKTTVFSNQEEEASKAQLQGGQMQFYPQTALEQAGMRFSKSTQPWQAHVVEDRELITGQNPASAPDVGNKLLQRLAGTL